MSKGITIGKQDRFYLSILDELITKSLISMKNIKKKLTGISLIIYYLQKVFQAKNVFEYIYNSFCFGKKI